MERAAKWELAQLAQVQAESAQAAAESVAPLLGIPSLVAGTEDPSRYCRLLAAVGVAALQVALFRVRLLHALRGLLLASR